MREVEVVDLQHRVDEVDQRIAGEIRDARRRAVLGEVVAGTVQAEAIVAEPDRLGTVDLRFTDDHLDVEAGPLLGGPPGGGDDLDRHLGVPALHLCGRRRGDVRAESIGGRYPHHALERAHASGIDRQRADRRFDGLGGRQRLATEVGELPAACDARQHPAAERLLQRGDAARDGGVVEAELLGRGVVAAGPAHGQQHQQVVGARTAAGRGCGHICIFADGSLQVWPLHGLGICMNTHRDLCSPSHLSRSVR